MHLQYSIHLVSPNRYFSIKGTHIQVNEIMKKLTNIFAFLASFLFIQPLTLSAQVNQDNNVILPVDSVIVPVDSVIVNPIQPEVNNDVFVQNPNANPSLWENRLRNRLNVLVNEAKRSRYSTGICVYDLTGDSILFMFNAQKRFRPASNEKLLTSISTLDLLGKDAEFSTSVYIDGRISNDEVMKVKERQVTENRFSETLGYDVPTEFTVYDTTYVYRRVLHGNIYIKGTFDPMFTTDDLHEMAKEIGKLDFEDLDGEFIGDISMKDSLVFGKGWCWDDMPSYYVPWLSPLIFNEGISLRPRSENYMKNPDKYFLENLLEDIRSRGKEIPQDCVRLSFQPTKAEQGTLIYRKSHTVGDVLTRMMKKSNNQFAEAMFYLLGYNNGKVGHPTTADDCAAQIMKVMRKAECRDVEETTIADGSGLSLYNYVTPENIVMLLRYTYKNKNIYDPLYEALPIAGVDGTLKGRMTSGKAHKNVHAKTGTVNGVSTLSGYVRASNGNMLAFSIMNNGVPSSSVGRNYQDRVCQELAK